MKRYCVTMFIEYCQSVEIEAENEDEAKEKAWEEFNIAKASQLTSYSECYYDEPADGPYAGVDY